MGAVATVGMPGAGKSLAAEVAREEGVPVVTMGDVIRREVERRGLEPTDDNMGRVAVELRETEGDDVVAERCVREVLEAEEERDVVLVDGLRSGAEVERFREELGDDLVVVAIHAPFDLRLERVSDRGRSDDTSEREELRRREEREVGYGMDEAIECADVSLENVGTINEFKDKFRGILQDASRLGREK